MRNTGIHGVAIAALLVAGAAGAGGHTDTDKAAIVEEGAELYAESCERCHGYAADGLREFDLDLDAFIDRLEGMTQEMPDFAGYFDEDELAAMHAYLESRARHFSKGD